MNWAPSILPAYEVCFLFKLLPDSESQRRDGKGVDISHHRHRSLVTNTRPLLLSSCNLRGTQV